jgi:hypothetical protein
MKIKIEDNYRVVVWPEQDIRFRLTSEKVAAERILQGIKRHVDCGHVTVMRDTYEICEFCRSRWEEDDDGAPLCCNKAVEEWERTRRLPPEARVKEAADE